jgi:hypothetical protein
LNHLDAVSCRVAEGRFDRRRLDGDRSARKVSSRSTGTARGYRVVRDVGELGMAVEIDFPA